MVVERRGRVLREYLGDRFCALYAAVKRGEMEDFQSYVSPLEYAWYLGNV